MNKLEMSCLKTFQVFNS